MRRKKEKKQAIFAPLLHKDIIQQQLRNLGVSGHGLKRPDSRYLHKLIHLDEQIGGIVYGWSNVGSPMIVATDRRVIILDKMPFFTNEVEISYEMVAGVTYSRAGPSSIITLHTRIKDYSVRSFNKKCDRNFLDYIELRTLEHKKKG